jgi:hypothetical protein
MESSAVYLTDRNNKPILFAHKVRAIGALTKGELVYFNGYLNGYPTVAAADGSDVTKPAQLVMLRAVADGQVGEAKGVATVGDFDTSAQSVGDLVYLNVTTPGSIQYTASTDTGTQVQPIGVVAIASTTGSIYFYPGISFETQLGGSYIQSGAITNSKLSSTAVTANKVNTGVQKLATATVTFAGAAPLITIPANSIVTDVMTVCTETFNGTTPAVTIGDDSVAAGFLTLGLATGLTNGVVKGEIASERGTLLWVPGVLSGGDWTVTQGTYTPSSWEVTALHVDGTTHSMDTKTQGSGAGSLSAGSQTKTAASMTTWGSPRRKYYATANHINVTIGTTGTPTTGALTVMMTYLVVA